MKALIDQLKQPIADLEGAKAFIAALEAEGLSWHFDDCPVDCLHETNPHVSREDAELLGRQRDRLYDFDWGAYECPIGYALHVFDPENYPKLD